MFKFSTLVIIFASYFCTTPAHAQPHALVQGWNLEGNDNGTAVDPNTIFGNATTPTSASPNVTTVWTWDKNLLKWNFFTPSMTPAALATYAASKGYGVLATIPQGQGFWVNAKNAISVNLTAPAQLGVFPFNFNGVQLNSMTFISMVNGLGCQATLSFTNVSAIAVSTQLIFDVIAGGVTTGQVLFSTFGLAPGATASQMSTTYIGACATTTLQFNSTASVVF